MQTLDLDLLRTFVAIAETGNFSSAAQAVFRTPSAVSMQVKKMEEALGRPLFTRDSRSVRLTEDGERV
ncbi:MAG: LysR family transcriptional regulator, partial [Pseudomonadota bacterium]